MQRVTRAGLNIIVVASALHSQSSAALAQIPAIIQGRIEDAVTRAPILEARVISRDSGVSVLTDSTGAFSIEVTDADSVTLVVEYFGYMTDSFELEEGAPNRITVLLLQPEPLELAGVVVEAEAAIASVLTQLERRRNIYPYSVQAYDGRTIAESTAYGSAWAFLRARAPRIHECSESRSGLCIGDRPAGFDLTGPGDDGRWMQRVGRQAVDVCIDGIRSNQAVQVLRTMSIGRLALLEIYWAGRGGIRAYSADYLNLIARMGGMYIPPVHSWDATGNRC